MISLKYAVVILTFASYSVATVLLSSPDPYVDGLHLLKDPDHKKEHWDMVKSSLDEMFPGVTCRVHTDNSTIQSPPNLITSSIESALMDIHPSISCTGELDEGVFLGGFDKGSHVLEKRSEVPVSFVLRLMVFVKEAKLQNLWYKRTRFPTSCPSSVLISKQMCQPCCCKECPNQEYHAAQAAAPHPYTKTAQDVQSEVKAQNAVGIEETKSGYVSCQHANHPNACIACVSTNSNKNAPQWLCKFERLLADMK